MITDRIQKIKLPPVGVSCNLRVHLQINKEILDILLN